MLALIRLVIARDELRARLRAATGSRIPLVSESTAMVAGYLSAERDLGRIAPAADIATLAPTLIGAAHLLFADSGRRRPGPSRRRQDRHHGPGRRRPLTCRAHSVTWRSVI